MKIQSYSEFLYSLEEYARYASITIWKPELLPPKEPWQRQCGLPCIKHNIVRPKKPFGAFVLVTCTPRLEELSRICPQRPLLPRAWVKILFISVDVVSFVRIIHLLPNIIATTMMQSKATWEGDERDRWRPCQPPRATRCSCGFLAGSP